MWSSGVKGAAVVAVAGLALGACDDTTGVPGTQQVAVAFSSGSSPTSSVQGDMTQSVVSQSLTIEGTNGSLLIEDLRIIVAEFELERLSDDDCIGEDDDDACEEFEGPPAFVDVPLDGGQVVAVTAAVEADTYDELEFEIEDLDDDEEDPVKAAQIAELLTDIRAQFPDWPRDASMLVTGSFTPTGGQPRPFRAYFEAEVEIEMTLNPPVTVTDDGAGATFTVNIAPSFWFSRGDGTVLDLSAFDYDATGSLIEFEVEIEDGFTELEFEDDDD